MTDYWGLHAATYFQTWVLPWPIQAQAREARVDLTQGQNTKHSENRTHVSESLKPWHLFAISCKSHSNSQLGGKWNFLPRVTLFFSHLKEEEVWRSGWASISQRKRLGETAASISACESSLLDTPVPFPRYLPIPML